MFASTVEAGKMERALDLVERLHLEKSYELAMAIADSHRKLVDNIEEVKDRKFPPLEYDEEGEESPPFHNDDNVRSRISPDGSTSRKRSVEETDERTVRQKPVYGGRF
jgi:hypothetical protein